MEPNFDPPAGDVKGGTALIACDLGGTNLSALALDLEGRPVGSIYTRVTLAEAAAEHTLANLHDAIAKAIEDATAAGCSGIECVGFGAKGPLDCLNGRLKAPSLPHL